MQPPPFIDYPGKYQNDTPKFVEFSPDSHFIVAGQYGEVTTWKLTE